MKNIDVEVYISQMITFFENNPNDLMSLIGEVQKEEFYNALREQCETNSKKGIKGDNNPSKRHEVRRKISIANSNRTIDENTKKKISLTLSGENGIKSKLKNEDVLFIRKHYIKNHIEYGSKPLSIKYNVCARTIQSIIQRTRWKYI